MSSSLFKPSCEQAPPLLNVMTWDQPTGILNMYSGRRRRREYARECEHYVLAKRQELPAPLGTLSVTYNGHPAEPPPARSNSIAFLLAPHATNTAIRRVRRIRLLHQGAADPLPLGFRVKG